MLQIDQEGAFCLQLSLGKVCRIEKAIYFHHIRHSSGALIVDDEAGDALVFEVRDLQGHRVQPFA